MLPHLFGEPGRDPFAGGRLGSVRYALSSLVPTCISREFTVLATGRTSPVVDWLRALAAAEHERCGGPGVGAVGMCFTGGYALAMATSPTLLAPVLSQPSLPFGPTAKWKRTIDISEADLGVVKQRCAAEGLEVLGLRFTSDRLVPGERFDFLRDELGDAFVAVELDDADANPASQMPPHSVLTEHLIDEPGQAHPGRARPGPRPVPPQAPRRGLTRRPTPAPGAPRTSAGRARCARRRLTPRCATGTTWG